MTCRGGFYEQYLTPVKNLQKPAPTQRITYINFDFDKISYGRTLTQETGFFTKSVAVTHLLGKKPGFWLPVHKS